MTLPGPVSVLARVGLHVVDRAHDLALLHLRGDGPRKGGRWPGPLAYADAAYALLMWRAGRAAGMADDHPLMMWWDGEEAGLRALIAIEAGAWESVQVTAQPEVERHVLWRCMSPDCCGGWTIDADPGVPPVCACGELMTMAPDGDPGCP